MAHILIIDDDRQIRDVMKKWLTLGGHEVLTATNGIEGIKILNAFRFDLLITDIIMPECDGLEVIMSLMKRAEKPRIIAMSGGAVNIDKEMILAAAGKMKVDRVLTKPLDYNELSTVVNELLQKPSAAT